MPTAASSARWAWTSTPTSTSRCSSARGSGPIVGLAPATLLILLVTFGFRRLRTRHLTAAREARSAEAALASERQRLGNIIEQIDIGTWDTTIDENGNHETFVDARWAAMLGRKAEDLNPLYAETFCPLMLHPDDPPILTTAMEESLTLGDRLLEFDVRLKHADGHWVWTRCAARPPNTMHRAARGAWSARRWTSARARRSSRR